MQASQSFKIVIVTLHLFRCCSTIKIRFHYSLRFRVGNLSVALLHFVIHCSVFKVRPLTTLAIRFEDLTFQSGLQIQQQTLSPAFRPPDEMRLYLALRARCNLGGPEWARTTDLAIISRTL